MFRKFLWILALLVVSNAAMFYWGETRLRQVRDEGNRRLDASARMASERLEEIERLGVEVDRLEAWGHLVDFQEELREIDLEIDNLNYGNALKRLDGLEQQIAEGEMGSLLAASAGTLENDFETVREGLSGMNDDAADRLRSLGRRAFEALSGFSAEAGREDQVLGEDEVLGEVEDEGDEALEAVPPHESEAPSEEQLDASPESPSDEMG